MAIMVAKKNIFERGEYVRINPRRGCGDDMYKVQDADRHEATVVSNRGEKRTFFQEHLYQDDECILASRKARVERAESIGSGMRNGRQI